MKKMILSLAFITGTYSMSIGANSVREEPVKKGIKAPAVNMTWDCLYYSVTCASGFACGETLNEIFRNINQAEGFCISNQIPACQ